MPRYKDRNTIKWLPFNSVINSDEMLNSIIEEKSKVTKPILSDEQILLLENTLLEAFKQNLTINVEYYSRGKIYKLNDKIKKIDFILAKIYFNNKILNFDQIIKIY